MTTSAANSSVPQTALRERVPPQDLDAEMALLGSMMMSRDAISDVIPIIGRSDSRWFYVPAHQKLFESLLDIYDDPTKAIDLIVVSDELRRRDLLDFVGGQDYMIQLAESFAEWANAEHYARIVRDRGMLRDLIQCAAEISESAYTAVDEAKDILDVAEQKIFQVTEKRVSGQARSLRELIDHLALQLEHRDGGTFTGLPTGFTQLDEYTSGLQPGDLIVVAARPSMGKTALGLTMAHHAAVEHRRPVAFFSMEMSNTQVTDRLVCSHGHGTDAQRLRRRMLSDEEINYLLVKVCPELASAPLFIDDTPGMTAMEMRSKARRLRQRYQIEAIYVDYLQLMHIPNSENRQVEIATISRQLKGVARELNIPVVAMAQLNRMPEGRSDKRPLMSDLRESGAIEQDADVVLLIHREEYYHPEKDEVKGLAELIIAKQRNGPTGTVQLSFNKKFTRFANFSNEPEPRYQSRTADAPF